MAKKKKRARTKAKRKPSVQKQLDVLCELVDELSEKISKLYLEVNRLTPLPRIPCAPPPHPPYGTGPWKPNDPPPYEVTCKSPSGVVRPIYMEQGDSADATMRVNKDS